MAAAADATVSSVTHDYLMECVLCGKGTDEQVHHSGGSSSTAAASSSDAAAAAAPSPQPPSFSLGAIQLNAQVAAPTKPDAKEEEEWQ